MSRVGTASAGAASSQNRQLPVSRLARDRLVLQLHFHVIGCFYLPTDLHPGLRLALNPRGVLATGLESGPLGVDAARGFVRACLQLI